MKDKKIWRLENLEPTLNDSEIDESKTDESKTDEDDDEEDLGCVE